MRKHLFWSVPVLSLALMACSPASEPEPEEPAANEEDTGETSGGETESDGKALSQIKTVHQQADPEAEATAEADKPDADETDAGQNAEPVATSETEGEVKPTDLLDEPEADSEAAEAAPAEEPQH